MDPYYIFPRELWEKIFDLMENPLDKLNLIRAYPILQAQCVETKEELLFLSALPMILDKLESSARLPNWHCERKNQQKPFFTLRLVSSSSCKVVDKWLESYWKKSTGDHEPPSFLSGQIFTQELLEKFTEGFPNHPETRAPLCRFVFLVVPNLVVPNTFRTNPARALAMEAEQNDKRVKVFGKVGSHLRKLRVVFFAECFPHRELMLSLINSLQNLLELTPNLQSLTLDFYCHWNDGIMATEEQFQFPKLPPLLDHLVINWFIRSKGVCNRFDSIREYFPQIVELKIQDILNFQDDYLKNAGLFPKLKTLKLERDTTFYSDSNSWEGKLRKICREIRAPNLVNIEFTFKDSWGVFETIQDWEEFKPRVEMLTRHSLFCLNKLNNFYSHAEPEYQWKGCCGRDYWSDYRAIKIKLSRKLD